MKPQENTPTFEFIKGQENFVNTTGLFFPYKYISTSQITKYLLCPMSYYWRYIERKKEPKNGKMFVGIVGHNILEMLADMNRLDFSESDLDELFHQTFKDEMEEVAPEEKTKEFLEEFETEKNKIFPSLKMYYRTEFQKLNIIAQEMQINYDMPIKHRFLSKKGEIVEEDRGKLTFVGFVDFFNLKRKDKVDKIAKDVFRNVDPKMAHELEIGDYKTGAEKDPSYFMSDMQMPFYSFATGIPNVRVDNVTPARIKFKKDGNPRKDNIPPTYNVMRYQPQEHDFKAMQKQFSDAAIGIGSGAFPMCHSSMWLCKPDNCGHWSYCRGKYDDDYYLKKVAQEKYQDKQYADRKQEENAARMIGDV